MIEVRIIEAQLYKNLSQSAQRKALPYPSRNMGLPYTKELSGTPSVSATVGDHQTYPLHALQGRLPIDTSDRIPQCENRTWLTT